jgi:hypothetical protein
LVFPIIAYLSLINDLNRTRASSKSGFSAFRDRFSNACHRIETANAFTAITDPHHELRGHYIKSDITRTRLS